MPEYLELIEVDNNIFEEEEFEEEGEDKYL